MVDIAWPPATLPLSGGEKVPTLQGGKIVGAPPSAFGSGGGGGGGGQVAASYTAIRTATFNPTQPLILNTPNKAGLFVAGAAARDNGGTIINDANGTSWYRVYDERVNAAWFYNGPGYFGDGVFDPNTLLPPLITASDQAANPQWLGLPPGGSTYPVGTAWQYVALQEATYACLASASVPGQPIVWNASTSSLNLPMWLPRGIFRINQPWYFAGRGFDIMFAERAGSQLIWVGANNVAPIQMDAIAYGAITNMSLADNTGVIAVPLVDCNWTGANPGLKTQQLTFTNMVLTGTNGQHGGQGFVIARSGGNSQGDTVTLINPLIVGVNQAIVMGGPNALNLTIIGGNIQIAYRDGAVTYGGSFQYYNMSWQAAGVDFHVYPQGNQINLDGADSHSYPGGGQTSRCCLRDSRSENVVMAYDQNNSTRIDNASIAQVWGIQGGWGQGAHYHIGSIITTNGNINRVVVLCDDGGPAWFPADSTSTNTVMVHQAPSPNWTVNQWQGYARWFRYGNGVSLAGLVSSNNANSATDTNGWYTPDPPVPPIVVPPLLGYYVKIAGVSGATQPNWDSFPPGNFSTTGAAGSVGYGFTTIAGSNVVSSNNIPANGNYVLVCGAIGVHGPAAASTVADGPLLGKVQNLTAGASFVASISGFTGFGTPGTMTVYQMNSGSIKIGAGLVGTGVYPATVTTGLASGTPGGVGVYNVIQGPNTAGTTPTANPVGTGTFQASIAGSVLTVTTVPAFGNLGAGQTIFGAGVPANTFITTTAGTGTGGIGTYNLSTSSTVASEPMTSGITMSTQTSWEMVNSLGEALPATYTLVDAMGYWGAPIPDGQVFWLPLDFDVIRGAASIDGCDPGNYGKFNTIGCANFAFPMDLTALARFRPSQGGLGNYAYRAGSNLGQPIIPQFISTAVTNITTTYVAREGAANIGNSLAAFTLNMPIWLTNIIQEFKVSITNQAAGAVLTFGTNITTSAPTISLGAVGTVTVLTFVWGFKPNVWLLTSVIGPI